MKVCRHCQAQVSVTKLMYIKKHERCFFLCLDCWDYYHKYDSLPKISVKPEGDAGAKRSMLPSLHEQETWVKMWEDKE